MREYNEHPIYGIGVRGTGKEWFCKGLVFDAEDKVTEIKTLECSELPFATKKQAEDHGLKLCKSWIDEQRAGSESAAPPKTGAI